MKTNLLAIRHKDMLEIFDNLEPKIYDLSDSQQKDQRLHRSGGGGCREDGAHVHTPDRRETADAELPAHGGGFVGRVQGPTEAGGEIGAEARRGLGLTAAKSL